MGLLSLFLWVCCLCFHGFLFVSCVVLWLIALPVCLLASCGFVDIVANPRPGPAPIENQTHLVTSRAFPVAACFVVLPRLPLARS